MITNNLSSVYAKYKTVSFKASLKERFEDRFIPEPNSGCWLWVGALAGNGYPQINIKKKHLKASRVSYELYKGPVPDHLCVLHKCDVRSCVNPDHLFLGTHKENSEDMVRKNRNCPGEKHWYSKLSKNDIIEVFSMYRSGMRPKDIAPKFGIGLHTVWNALKGKTYKEITNDMAISRVRSRSQSHS